MSVSDADLTMHELDTAAEISIYYSNLDKILEEEYTAEFQRVTYIGPEIEELTAYSINVTYRLVDCSKDFELPSVFIEPVPVDEFQYSVVNYFDEGLHYFT